MKKKMIQGESEKWEKFVKIDTKYNRKEIKFRIKENHNVRRD